MFLTVASLAPCYSVAEKPQEVHWAVSALNRHWNSPTWTLSGKLSLNGMSARERSMALRKIIVGLRTAACSGMAGLKDVTIGLSRVMNLHACKLLAHQKCTLIN